MKKYYFGDKLFINKQKINSKDLTPKFGCFCYVAMTTIIFDHKCL